MLNRPQPWDPGGQDHLRFLRGGKKMKNTMNKISWRLILELIEAIVEAILRIFGGKSDKNKDQK